MRTAVLALAIGILLIGCISQKESSSALGCDDKSGDALKNCMSRKAQMERNIRLCTELKDEESRKYCISEYAANVDYLLCSVLKIPADRDKCLVRAAKVNASEKPCEMISSKEEVEDCMLNTAISTSNYGICSKITDLSKNRVCANTIPH